MSQSPTATGGSEVGAGGSSSGGRDAGFGGTGSTPPFCTVGADQTCNEDPRVSSLLGRCQAGACQCNAGTERSATTGKCSSTCYSPRQNVDLPLEAGGVGCACDPAVDYDTCRADSFGGLLDFSCNQGTWRSGGHACEIQAATITLRRSPCFGVCPVYSVTLTLNGLVDYEGTRYVKVHGQASHVIAPSAVRALADYLEDARYFELSVPQTCREFVTDQPIVTTSLERYGKKHDIVHDLGNGCAPPVLTALEQRIDEVAGTAEWVTCPPDDYCRDP